MNTKYLLISLLTIFMVLACGEDEDACVDCEREKINLEIILTWEKADGDLNLIVEDPEGNIINAQNVLHSGDATNGPGEESVIWQSTASDGSYTVYIDYVAGDGSVIYRIDINTDEESSVNGGSVSENSPAEIISFIKEGEMLRF